jgi:hypothetical protein
MSSIFFNAVRPGGDPTAEPQVVCRIYSDTGRILANHFMTLEGAITRMHDLEAAIDDCRERREADLKFGAPI